MDQVLGVMLTVSDIHRMSTFFTEVLFFKKIGETKLEGEDFEKFYGIKGGSAQFVILRLGKEYLYLIAFSPPGRAYPKIRSNDHLFQHMAIVVSDMEKVHRELIKYGIQAISEGPETIPEWNEAAAGIKAFYFRSPEGHPLELIYFPHHKGRAIWQEQKEKVFLGIDHTAMVVSHTDKSLHFYRDSLNMKVMGESLNHGITQERLSGVPGAKVQITGLGYKGSEGMGLEFLHYLNPSDGKSIPPMKANDLGCTYTIIKTKQFRDWDRSSCSSGFFSAEKTSEKKPALLTIDPDGHRIILIEP